MSGAEAVDIPKNFGAFLLGGFLSSFFSGTVVLQTILYFKISPQDGPRMRVFVSAVCLFDLCHTIFIWIGAWEYFINEYGDSKGILLIPWSVAATVVLTALITFIVHCFFARRVLRLSKNNYFLTLPIATLAFLRLVAAAVSTHEMIYLGSFVKFTETVGWVFTTGLSLSSGVDILITLSLVWLLRRSRTAHLSAVIDEIILYTFETGALTCITTLVSLICWLTMPNNLIFFGLHVVIAKLYATSLLVTLNTRFSLRAESGQYSRDGPPVLFLNTSRRGERSTLPVRFSETPTKTELQINVQRSVEYTVEDRQVRADYDYGQGFRNYEGGAVSPPNSNHGILP